MRLANCGLIVALSVVVGGCGPHTAMSATCKVVANPDMTSEPKLRALAEAFARQHGYAFVVLDGTYSPYAVTVVFSGKPTLRLIKRNRLPAYAAFFYGVEGVYSRERVKADANQFAADAGNVAGLNLRPMQSDETPPLNTDESACVSDQAT
jgi:hypothetical protein